MATFRSFPVKMPSELRYWTVLDPAHRVRIGTGGTISGNSRFLKEKVAASRPGGHLEVVGADPDGSAYSDGHPGEILVDGVGNSWPQAEWPRAFDRSIVTVSCASPTTRSTPPCIGFSTTKGLRWVHHPGSP